MLSEHGLPIAPSTYYEHVHKRRPRGRSAMVLIDQIRRVHADNYGSTGRGRCGWTLNREGIPVARCTVERLMRELAGTARSGARSSAPPSPTRPPTRPGSGRPGLRPAAPDRLWVADITYVSTWSGWVYVAFVIDAFARRIIGWRCGSSMSTQLVLDALEQAVWTRQREDASLDSVVAHTDRGSQYTAIRYTERLAEAGIAASVGTVGIATTTPWPRRSTGCTRPS